VSQIQGRIEGLLKPDWKGQARHKGQPPSQTGQQHFAKGRNSPFEGTAAAFRNSFQPATTAAKSEQPSSLEAHRSESKSASCVANTGSLASSVITFAFYVISLAFPALMKLAFPLTATTTVIRRHHASRPDDLQILALIHAVIHAHWINQAEVIVCHVVFLSCADQQ